MSLDTQDSVENADAVLGKLRLFSLHLDFSAAIRARWAASTITKLAGPHWLCTAESWKIESLNTASSIRQMLVGDGARADVLIIAASSLERRETDLVQWLESLAAGGAGRPGPGLLIGLFGDENQMNRELDWTVKRMMKCAQAANRDFIWHWMEEAAAGEPEWLTSHLETYLARKLSALDHHFLQEPTVEFA
jgi:hypothetical protein